MSRTSQYQHGKWHHEGPVHNLGGAENLISDDGSHFRAHVTQKFLKRRRVDHGLSADYNFHANYRAESAVKTAKRMLMSSTGSDGN